VIGPEARAAMKRILADIQSGAFADEWMAECAAGKPKMKQLAASQSEHDVEKIGRRLRALMPWLKSKQKQAVPVSDAVGV
jgi:ketol-acid reductoisomerase